MGRCLGIACEGILPPLDESTGCGELALTTGLGLDADRKNDNERLGLRFDTSSSLGFCTGMSSTSTFGNCTLLSDVSRDVRRWTAGLFRNADFTGKPSSGDNLTDIEGSPTTSRFVCVELLLAEVVELG